MDFTQGDCLLRSVKSASLEHPDICGYSVYRTVFDARS